MSETRTLWQRCEALGQFEDFKDDHVRMRYSVNRWLLEHDGHIVLFIYEHQISGSPWLADAILSHIERIRIGKEFERRLKDHIDAKIYRLPAVTYVVEAPKPTEPTQEQLRDVYAYGLENIGPSSGGLIYIDNLRGITGAQGIRLMCSNLTPAISADIIKMDGSFEFLSTEPFDNVCKAIGFHGNKQREIEQSPESITIHLADWQEMQSAFATLAKHFQNPIQPVPYQS